MCRRLPAGEFGGEFGEKVAGSTAAGLREGGGVVGEGRRGRRPVVRGGAAVSQLASVEGAAAGGASREAQSVGRGGVGDAVGRRHRVPLTAGRHGNAAEEDGGGRRKRLISCKVLNHKHSFSTAVVACTDYLVLYVFYRYLFMSLCSVLTEEVKGQTMTTANHCNGKTTRTVQNIFPPQLQNGRALLFLHDF